MAVTKRRSKSKKNLKSKKSKKTKSRKQYKVHVGGSGSKRLTYNQQRGLNRTINSSNFSSSASNSASNSGASTDYSKSYYSDTNNSSGSSNTYTISNEDKIKAEIREAEEKIIAAKKKEDFRHAEEQRRLQKLSDNIKLRDNLRPKWGKNPTTGRFGYSQKQTIY